MPEAQGAWEGPLDPSWAPHLPRGSGLGALASVTRGPPDGQRCPSHQGAPPSATPRSHRIGCGRHCLSPCGPLPTNRCPPHRPGPGHRLQVEAGEAQIGWRWGGGLCSVPEKGGTWGMEPQPSGYISCWKEEPPGDQEAWGCWQYWA